MSKQYNYDDCYMLKRAIPGFPAGTIFQHRKHDKERNLGSISNGYLTNIWIEGDCQTGADGVVGWAAETHILPGCLRDCDDWFTPVKMVGKEKGAIHNVKGVLFREQS